MDKNDTIEELSKGSLQRKHPYDPAQDTTDKERVTISNWQIHADRSERNKIPRLKGEGRFRALHGLHKDTEVRTNPETGKREFLLHRGASEQDDKKSKILSYTTDKETAAGFARRGRSLMSEWIPEDRIHHILDQVGYVNDSATAYVHGITPKPGVSVPHPTRPGEGLPRSIGKPGYKEKEILVVNPNYVPKVKKVAKAEEKFESLVDDWLGSLKKMIHDEDIAPLLRASTRKGKDLVDHTGHLNDHPPHLEPEVNEYRNEVLNSPKSFSGFSLGGNDLAPEQGVTQKHVVQNGDKQYLLKPYHESLAGFSHWQKHPYQGWAEMANQGLYHAAGIGDFHQKVHTSEHNGHPLLVVHMDNGMDTVSDHLEKGRRGFSPEFHDNIRKMAVMDFLTNNLDRHAGNLLYNSDTGKGIAIDHGRNFQYQKNAVNKREDFRYLGGLPPEERYDSLGYYVLGPGGEDMYTPTTWHIHEREDHQDNKSLADSYADTLDKWWPQVSQSVRNTLHKHLSYIKDPNVRQHVLNNFETRAKYLDDVAEFGSKNRDWLGEFVPMYPEGDK